MEINYETLPNRYVEYGIRNYIETGRPMGGFLTAVFENDLFRAVGKADLENRRDLTKLVIWIYNNAPLMCWGSPEKVSEWKGRDYYLKEEGE